MGLILRPLCVCGCGKRVKKYRNKFNRFIYSHNTRMKGELHFNWKGDFADKEAKRDRARKLYLVKDKICKVCISDKNIERHHIDNNPGNNDPENIMFICKSCHMKLHHYGSHLSQVTKNKLSNIFSGENNPFYGKRHSQKTKNQISESLKKYYINRIDYGNQV